MSPATKEPVVFWYHQHILITWEEWALQLLVGRTTGAFLFKQDINYSEEAEGFLNSEDLKGLIERTDWFGYGDIENLSRNLEISEEE